VDQTIQGETSAEHGVALLPGNSKKEGPGKRNVAGGKVNDTLSLGVSVGDVETDLLSSQFSWGRLKG